MAYGDDIDALGNSHRYQLSSNANDSVGTANGTNSGGVFTGNPICEDAINSYVTNGLTDRITLPTTSTINNSNQRIKSVAGWFMTTGFQAPPTRIYGEGDNTTVFQIVMAFGNNVIFEVIQPVDFSIQVFGISLQPNRPYHFCALFQGISSNNIAQFFIDGVEMTASEPSNPQPNVGELSVRGVGIFGDPSGTVGIGAGVVLCQAARNGHYNQWAHFDQINGELTQVDIRETLFEKGALPINTISSGNEATMQIALDLFANTIGPNSCLQFRVESVIGDGDLTLELDNYQFDPLTSIHIQYMGTGTLTIRNINNSNASIASTPNGGSVVFVKPVSVELNVLDALTLSPIQNARVRILDDQSSVILNELTNSSGIINITYDYIEDTIVSGRSRQTSTSPYYKQANISSIITENGLALTVLMVKDE